MDIELLTARINDLKNSCQKTNSPKFIGFLSGEETAKAKAQLNQTNNYLFFGGYDGAERVMLGLLPEWCNQPVFPIKAVTFKFRECDKLSHRDFLGALMALGIARETIGDILVEQGRAVVFVVDSVLKFVLTQVEKIGRVGVAVTEGCDNPLPQMSKKLSFTDTVASMRIDCVVSAICGISRNKASDKITDGLVLINSVCVNKTTATVKSGDKITVRKMDKYDITECDEHSKKGRIILKYDKYV